MTDKEYIEKEKYIWENFVPSRGQAKYTKDGVINIGNKILKTGEETLSKIRDIFK